MGFGLKCSPVIGQSSKLFLLKIMILPHYKQTNVIRELAHNKYLSTNLNFPVLKSCVLDN